MPEADGIEDGQSFEAQTIVTELRSRSHSDWEAFAALQQELKRIARAKMRRERVGHTLGPTALVNEAFLKLFKGSLPPDFWTDTRLAVRYMAKAMGWILKDHADAFMSAQRGGPRKIRVPLDDSQARDMADGSIPRRLESELVIDSVRCEEILAVRKALLLLRQTSSRAAQVVELHFYGGLTYEEIAAILGLSIETIRLDWRKAKAFLKVSLSNHPE